METTGPEKSNLRLSDLCPNKSSNRFAAGALLSFETMPIERFLAQIMLHPRVSAITAEIRAEPTEMLKALAGQFREVGLFYVNHYNQHLVLEMTIKQLQCAPEIAIMERRAILAEESRKKTRT